MNIRYSVRRRAFSLIEASIILGILGLVVAGIWHASSAFQQTHQITQFSRQVISITKAWGNLYKGVPSGTPFDATAFLINAGVVPVDMVDGNKIQSPWGGEVRLRIDLSGQCSLNRLVITLQYPSTATCLRVVKSLAYSRYIVPNQIGYFPEGHYTNINTTNGAMSEAHTHCPDNTSMQLTFCSS